VKHNEKHFVKQDETIMLNKDANRSIVSPLNNIFAFTTSKRNFIRVKR